jgi:hypothetical protein
VAAVGPSEERFREALGRHFPEAARHHGGDNVTG